ncbi:MAG: hypothetical protein IJU23_12945 [Proteobacteria bacterium]|nr:hypothetical protein [Pseudomonadota bacterium]
MKPTEPIILNTSKPDTASVPVTRHRRVVDMTDIVTNTAHSRTPSDKSKKGSHKKVKKTAPGSQIDNKVQDKVQQESASPKQETPNVDRSDTASSSSAVPAVNEGHAAVKAAVPAPKAAKTDRKKKESGVPAKSSSAKKTEKTTRKNKPVQAKTTQEQLQVNDYIINALMLQSWLSRQWCSCITKLFPNTASLFTKGISFVQARLVNDFYITTDSLEAIVVEQLASVQLRHFDPNHWKKVIERLSDKAIFAAELLNGELSEDIINSFTEENLPLFPKQASEFTFSCNCGAEKMPCEHVCALLLAFAQTLKDSPFNILMLRGMSPESLIAQLNEKRSLLNSNDKLKTNYNNEMPVKDINFGLFYAPRGDFSDIQFHISHESSTLIKRLGTPEAWSADHFVGCSVESCMSPIIEAVSREAEKLGLSEPWQMALTQKEREELEAHRLKLELEQQKLALMHTQNRRRSIVDDENHATSVNASESKYKRNNRYQVRDTKRLRTAHASEKSFNTQSQDGAAERSASTAQPREVRRTVKLKKTSATPKRRIPDLSFVVTAISPEILELVQDPVEKVNKMYEWLLKGGQTDVRTLARRTQLTKPIIQAFLTVLCDAGMVRRIIIDEEKVKYEVI